MKLSFSVAAVDDLEGLRRFIAEYNPSAAQRISKQLIGAIGKLSFSAQVGRLIPELPGEIREMVFGRYVVRYAVKDEQGYILRIWHGKEHRCRATDIC